nr:hypothetical protein [Micromonospora kangleipakensis]
MTAHWPVPPLWSCGGCGAPWPCPTRCRELRADVDDAPVSRTQRISYEEYLVAVALTLARRHRPVWSWRKWRQVCRCGADLPCRARHRIPINRGHWPGEETQ